MKNTNTESSNTDKMRQHQLTKAKIVHDGLRHEDLDLMQCTDVIDQSRTTVLNSSSDHASVMDVLKANPDDKALASDVDPQLLVKVFFKEKVNLVALNLRFNRAPNAGDDDESYSKPRLVKFYANMDNLDFDDVSSATPSGQLIVEGAEEDEARFNCSGHKFQRLESLQVFIEEGYDAEATRSFINRLSLIGHKAQSYHAEYK